MHVSSPTRADAANKQCLACGYSLEGLGDFGRCPECANVFRLGSEDAEEYVFRRLSVPHTPWMIEMLATVLATSGAVAAFLAWYFGALAVPLAMGLIASAIGLCWLVPHAYEWARHRWPTNDEHPGWVRSLTLDWADRTARFVVEHEDGPRSERLETVQVPFDDIACIESSPSTHFGISTDTYWERHFVVTRHRVFHLPRLDSLARSARSGADLYMRLMAIATDQPRDDSKKFADLLHRRSGR